MKWKYLLIRFFEMILERLKINIELLQRPQKAIKLKLINSEN
jgi:hypothetical protein